MAKREIRKKFWLNDMEALLFVTLALIVIGTINVFSASFVKAEMDYGTPYFFLLRQCVILGVGCIAFFIGFRVNYHQWRSLMPFVFLGTVAALIAVLFIGVNVNGARRWLSLPFFQLQPAEIAKLVSVMLISSYLAFSLKHHRPVSIFNKQIVIIGVMALLIEKEPDAGTMGIVVAVPMLLMILAGLSKRKCIFLLAAAALAFIALLYVQPYRLARMMVVYDPWADAQKIGYQTVQSMSAIGSGGLTGMGLGLGVSKYDYLPEAHTDFAFSVWSQEMGFIGVALVLLLYIFFVIYGMRIAMKARDIYGEILATGIVLLIGFQAAVNLLMVGGAFFVVGVPLPFISYGGTSMVVSLWSVGMLVNIGYDSALSRRHIALRREQQARDEQLGLYLVKK